MTDRERFLNVLEFKAVDRVPNYELGFWPQTIKRWFREDLPEDVLYLPAYDSLGEPYFGIDRRESLPIKVGPIPGFEIETIEESERYLIFRSRSGIVRKALKEGTVDGRRLSMDQYIDFPVKNRQDFKKMKRHYNPQSPIRYPRWWEETVRVSKDRTYPLGLFRHSHLGFYGQLRDWVGTENLSYMFFDEPLLVHEMLDFVADFIIEVSKRALSSVKTDFFLFFEDFAYKTGPLISPKIFKEFFMPRYKRVTEHFRKHGIHHLFLDSDGNLEVLIPLLIECGITSIVPLEQAAGMDPVKLRKEYGKDLTFGGGIDKRVLIKDKKAIEKELLGKVPRLLEQSGYFPYLDHTFPPDISYQNFLYYMELKQKLLRGS